MEWNNMCNFVENKKHVTMTQITQDNFDMEYQDVIEIERIDKFVSDEMDRQMHRYIKAYHGSKEIMDKFIQRLKGMTVEQKEEAIAAYIDINRKAVSGLDLHGQLLRHLLLFQEDARRQKEV